MSKAETIRLTMAQAVVKYLARQFVTIGGQEVPFFGGVWAIFGHGNVAGIGEALHAGRDTLRTYRAHNEQGMANAAIAYAKANACQRAMVCTTSIGPGATNMVTAAALAHVNRLPVLFLPGDVFANRRPDPVLQQIEDFDDGTVSANDCFRPVSRYFDRISRPEQILTALPRSMMTLTSPERRGPVVLSLCQDVQAEAFDYPLHFFEKRTWCLEGQTPSEQELSELAEKLKSAKRPIIVAGGGVIYADAASSFRSFVESTKIPVVETQAGKGALAWDHNQSLGAVGVTGTSAANAAVAQADLVVGIGTRLQDFTTASRTMFNHAETVQINVSTYDAFKHRCTPIISDAKKALDSLERLLSDFSVSPEWVDEYSNEVTLWTKTANEALEPTSEIDPSDAQVLGALMRQTDESAIVVCAAGGLPGELHKLWRQPGPGSYHVEYGYSCMGYEIAGGLGVALAKPDNDVYVVVGDGSYMMMNSEIASAVAMGVNLSIVVLDNRGFGCINRLQQGCGGQPFNNLLEDSYHQNMVPIDFAQHAASMGAAAVKVTGIAELEKALEGGRNEKGVKVYVIDTTPHITTDNGDVWWDVAVPEVSVRSEVSDAFEKYQIAQRTQETVG